MIDIDTEFRKLMGPPTGTANQPEPADEPLTVAKLQEAMRKMRDMPPPPPPIHITRAATALPSAKPKSDYMREMVARVGLTARPACFRVNGPFGEFFAVHPDLIRDQEEEK